MDKMLGPSNTFHCPKCSNNVCLAHRFADEHECTIIKSSSKTQKSSQVKVNSNMKSASKSDMSNLEVHYTNHRSDSRSYWLYSHKLKNFRSAHIAASSLWMSPNSFITLRLRIPRMEVGKFKIGVNLDVKIVCLVS